MRYGLRKFECILYYTELIYSVFLWQKSPQRALGSAPLYRNRPFPVYYLFGLLSIYLIVLYPHNLTAIPPETEGDPSDTTSMPQSKPDATQQRVLIVEFDSLQPPWLHERRQITLTVLPVLCSHCRPCVMHIIQWILKKHSGSFL